MLLSTSSFIPEGSVVEVSVGVDHLPDTGILLSARGKVIRVHSKDSGDFSVAIKLDGGFSLPLAQAEARTEVRNEVRNEVRGEVRTELRTESARSSIDNAMSQKPPSPITPRSQPVLRDGMQYSLAWHTET
jgi:hypothetical protein